MQLIALFYLLHNSIPFSLQIISNSWMDGVVPSYVNTLFPSWLRDDSLILVKMVVVSICYYLPPIILGKLSAFFCV